FWRNVQVPGRKDTLSKNLEFAGRVADFLELGELMGLEAPYREEACGGHVREECQTADGGAHRNDDELTRVAAWEYSGDLSKPTLHKENLEFEAVELTTRSYK